MGKFHVVEQFVSINGEGRRTGQLALFIRFAGCNLNCEYCDTKWANDKDAAFEEYDENEIYQLIKEKGVKNITLTGGEPLLQKNIKDLLDLLQKDDNLRIEIETNGSVSIEPFFGNDNLTFTLDYKLSVSGMEDKMCLSNYEKVRGMDTVKFVVGSREDLLRSKEIIEKYNLISKGCGIYLSPCFGAIDPSEMADFLVEQNMNDVNIQLQLHKFIWDPNKRGV